MGETTRIRREASGKLTLNGLTLHYDSRGYGTWELPVNRIKMIGEFTAEPALRLDDHFLVFLADGEAAWREASCAAEGVDAAIDGLGALLATRLELTLKEASGYRSRVLWPKEIEGQRLFDFYKPDSPTGFWGRMRHSLVPSYYYRLSGDLRQRFGLSA